VSRPADVLRGLRRTAIGATGGAPGRIVLATLAGLARVQIFDRSMTVAAQAFTSVFPILILLATLLGRGASTRIADAADLPAASQRLLDDTLRGSGIGAFGVVGALVVLVSATGLSRALARAYGAVWELTRVPGGLTMALRWLATVLVLCAFLVGSRLLDGVAHRLPPAHLSSIAILALADVALAVSVPWLVLGGAVPARLLVPGGVVFGVTMLGLRPAASVLMPRAMNLSVERYGTIGLAFTYVSWLYVLSFALLTAAVVGHAVARDAGPVGRLVRGSD
jgi:membrane protein